MVIFNFLVGKGIGPEILTFVFSTISLIDAIISFILSMLLLDNLIRALCIGIWFSPSFIKFLEHHEYMQQEYPEQDKEAENVQEQKHIFDLHL